MSLFSNESPQLAETATVNGSKIQNVFHISFPLTAASVNSTLFIAPVGYRVQSITETHSVAGGTGATCHLEVIPSGTANGSGTTIAGTTLALTGAANVIQKATPTSTTGATIPAGSRLGVVVGGTLTGLAGGVLQVSLVRV